MSNRVKKILEKKRIKLADGTPDVQSSDAPATQFPGIDVAKTQADPNAVDPSLAPQHFLGRVMNKTFLGDQKPKGEEVQSIDSPVDIIAGGLGGYAAERMMEPKENVLKLLHYSEKPNLTTIDPQFAGAGVDARSRGRDLENKISHYYVEGQPQSPADVGIVRGPYKYSVEVNQNENPIYDFAKDPKGVIKKVTDANNGAFRLDAALDELKKQGYAGFRNSVDPDAPNAVRMLRPMPVKEQLSNAVPNNKIRDVAENYAESQGLKINHPTHEFEVDPSRGARIAQAFESMEHNPNAPETKKAYDALINETENQFKAIQKTGLKVSKIQPGQPNPYPQGSKQMIEDVTKNNHMWYYPTEQGFGSEAASAQSHPLLQTSKIKINGEEAPANDIFRIVHDYFGHAKEGNTFGPKGEENAWVAHKQMYTPEAQRAMTTETRGQNSWVNFGPKGAENRANPTNTTFAEQKAGLLPDWVNQEVPAQGKKKFIPAEEEHPPLHKVVAEETLKDRRDAAIQGTGERAKDLLLKSEGAGELSDKGEKGKKHYDEGGGVSADPSQGLEQQTAPTQDISRQASGLMEEQMPAAPMQQAPDMIDVMSPTGEMGSIPHHQLSAALSQGYTQPSPEELQKAADEARYGGAGQMAATFGEGVGQGVAGPLAPLAEKAVGVEGENIAGRARTNPWMHGLGVGAGLVGATVLTRGANTMLTLPGAAGKLATLGADAILGSTPAATAGVKIGSAAIKGFIENAVVAGSDEISKQVIDPSRDPSEAIQTGIVNTGLAGLLGGVIGAGVGSVSPLWAATVGKDTHAALKAMTDHVGGIDGAVPSFVDDAIAKTGIEVPPEIRASLSEDPFIRQHAQILMDSANPAGIKYQEQLKTFRDGISAKMTEAFGKTPEEIENLKNLDTHQVGVDMKDDLISEIQKHAAPIEESYNRIAGKFVNTPIDDDILANTMDKIASLKLPGEMTDSASAQFIDRVSMQIPNIKNLEQLRNFASDIGNQTRGIAKQELWGTGAKIKNALMDAEEQALDKAIGTKAPELLAEHQQTNQAYRAMKSVISDLDDRLHVGNHTGVKTFISALKELDPETIVSRLNPTNRAGIIQELRNVFPSVAEKLKDYHLSKVLKSSMTGDELNTAKLIKKINYGISPQMREFIVPEGALPKMEALQALHEAIPEKIGKSGTPQGVAKIMHHLTSSALGLASLVHGNGIVGSALVSAVAEKVGGAPDAVRLALLKALGSNQPINSGAFKATVDTVQALIKGEKAIHNGTANLFKAGREVMSLGMVPDHKSIDKLDNRLKEIQANPQLLTQVGSQMGNYMPDHAMAAAGTAANAANYLNSMRPGTGMQSPMDSKLPPDPIKQAEFHNALAIAQQPLVVLQKIQTGNLTPQDIVTMKTIYPALYGKMVSQITDQLVQAGDKGIPVPYELRLGLSMFMHQPLDSTMTPQGIMSAQSIFAPKQPPQQSGQPKGNPSAPGLQKLPASYQTPQQARSAEKSMGK